MDLILDDRKVPDGTLLLIGIEYPNMTTDKTFTYALLKAGGYWYTTGTGRVPQAAGWGAVRNWLARDGRVVKWVKLVTETAAIWPEVREAEPAPGFDTSQPSE